MLVQLGNRGRTQREDLGVSAVLVHQENPLSGHGVTVDRVVQEERLEKDSQGLRARLLTPAQEDAQDAQVQWGKPASMARWDPKALVVLVAWLVDAAKRETVVCLGAVARKAAQDRLESVGQGVFLAKGAWVHLA